MKDNGQCVCSKGNDQFNEDLFDMMLSDERHFDVNDPYQCMQFISHQNIKMKELFRRYYYNDPRTRNEYSVVSDTELLMQQLQALTTTANNILT